MPDRDRTAESLVFDFLAPLAAEPLEVSGPGAGALRDRLAALARARGAKHLAALLEGASPAPGNDAPRAVLLVHDPAAGTPAVEAAFERLAPGGSMLVLTAPENDAALERALAARPAYAFGAHERRGAASVVFARRRRETPCVVLMSDGADMCVTLRATQPLRALEQRGELRVRMVNHFCDVAALAEADLLLLVRACGPAGAKMLAAARRLGIPTALDIDDDMSDVPWFNPDRAYYADATRALLRQYVVRNVGTILTTVPYLAERLRASNPHVLLQPNTADTSVYVPDWRATHDARTTFAYTGSLSHREDLRPLLRPLARLLREARGHVRFVAAFVPEELRGLPGVESPGWYLNSRLAADRLSMTGANVGLAPLIDLPFNRAKSAIKYLEYGACGMCTLASDVLTFRDVVRDGATGLLVREHTEEAWDAALRWIVAHPEERVRMARAAHEDVVLHHSVTARTGEVAQHMAEALRSGSRSTAEALRRAPAAPPASAAAETRDVAFAVLVGDDVDEALARLSDWNTAAAGRQLIVVTHSRTLYDIVAGSGERECVLVDTSAALPAHGVDRALALARAPRLAVVEARVAPSRTLLAALAAALDGSTAPAAGPRLDGLVEPSMQRVDAHPAGSRTSAPAAVLHPAAVLLDAVRVARLGGLAAAATWDDALADLCLAAAAQGTPAVVASDGTARVVAPVQRGTPAAWRVASRAALAARWRGRPEWDRARDVEPVRLHAPAAAPASTATAATAAGPLALWVYARPATTYLAECLARLARHVAVPHTLHVIHEDEPRAREAAAHAGAIAHPYSAGRPVNPLDLLLREPPADRVLLLHDGVMTGPGAVRALLAASLAHDGIAALPLANDGGPDQLIGATEPLLLENLDRAAADFALRAGSAPATRRPGRFCWIVPGAVLAGLSTAERAAFAGGAWDVLDRRAAPHAVAGAYVHVLAHPAELAALGIAADPAAPLGLALPPVLERLALGAAPDPLALDVVRGFLAVRDRAGHVPRAVASMGWILLWRGNVDAGMDMLEKARAIDPFDPLLAAAEERALAWLPAATARERGNAPAGAGENFAVSAGRREG